LPASMSTSSYDAKAVAYEFGRRCARLGPITVWRESGPLSSRDRAKRQDFSVESETSLYLVSLLGDSALLMRHSGIRIGPYEAVLLDADSCLSFERPAECEAVLLGLPLRYVQQWLTDEQRLLGRRISNRSGWGSALCAFLRQLTPEWIVRAPMSHTWLADQLGTLLSFVAIEMCEPESASKWEVDHLTDRIRAFVAQHYADPALTAGEVASSLRISRRTLHRVLAAEGQTFARVLLEARTQAAVRMLASPLFKRLTTAEVGRRSGFSGASHFAKVLRRHTGTTPLRFRLAHVGPQALFALDPTTSQVVAP